MLIVICGTTHDSMTNKEKKQYAAVYYALGWARGMLSGALDGTADRDEIQMVLDATGAAEIAKAIGMTEQDLFPDLDRHLTDAEKWAISKGTDAR